MGQRDSRSAVFLCQPHRELWRPSSQRRGTSEPQRPRKAEEGASHMAYSYLLVVEYGGPGSEEGKDVPKVTHKFDGAQLLWLPADHSWAPPSLSRSRQLPLISPPDSFTHLSLFLGNDSFTLQGVLSGN